MNTQDLLDPKRWAEHMFGSVQLHAQRRTGRAVKAAHKLAENPLGSLPAQMQSWKEAKALYRLLEEPDVTFAALMQPHLQQTREQANSSKVTLLVQDTTALDLSHRHKMEGVGQIGNEHGRGFARANRSCHRASDTRSAWMYRPGTVCPCSRSPRGTTSSAAATSNPRN